MWMPCYATIDQSKMPAEGDQMCVQSYKVSTMTTFLLLHIGSQTEVIQFMRNYDNNHSVTEQIPYIIQTLIFTHIHYFRTVAYVKVQQIQNNKTQTCLLLQYIQPLPIFFDIKHLSIPYPVTSTFLGHPVCPATKLTAFNKDDMMMMHTYFSILNPRHFTHRTHRKSEETIKQMNNSVK